MILVGVVVVKSSKNVMEEPAKEPLTTVEELERDSISMQYMCRFMFKALDSNPVLAEHGCNFTGRLRIAFGYVDRASFLSGLESQDKLQSRLYEIYNYRRPYLHKKSPEAMVLPEKTIAIMISLLDINDGNEVLVVNSGFGLTSALLAYIVGSNGSVITTESNPEVKKRGDSNLRSFLEALQPEVQAQFSEIFSYLNTQDDLNFLQDETFDRIFISSMIKMDQVPSILRKLSLGGVMVALVKSKKYSAKDYGSVYVFKKDLNGNLRGRRTIEYDLTH